MSSRPPCASTGRCAQCANETSKGIFSISTGIVTREPRLVRRSFIPLHLNLFAPTLYFVCLLQISSSLLSCFVIYLLVIYLRCYLFKKKFFFWIPKWFSILIFQFIYIFESFEIIRIIHLKIFIRFVTIIILEFLRFFYHYW